MPIPIGRRKTAIARIIASSNTNINSGIFVNGLPVQQYFHYNAFQLECIQQSFTVLGISSLPNLSISVYGGGLSAQAQACQLAIARLLQSRKPAYRQLLKSKGLLTQDSRQKERRKYGLKKARKAPQFSKR